MSLARSARDPVHSGPDARVGNWILAVLRFLILGCGVVTVLSLGMVAWKITGL